MRGAFRFIKSIAASLSLAAVAFVMQYGQHFLFRSVEQPAPGLIANHDSNQSQTSVSAQRSVPTSATAVWRMAVVTNRELQSPDELGLGDLADPQSTTLSLADQVKHLLYLTPKTSYGTTSVSVSLHRKRGTCRIGPTGVEVGELATTDRDSFLRGLSTLIGANSGKDVLVFIHGFNVSLEEATARAAQVAEDMPFDGTMIVFSWQSAAKTREYLNDEKLAERYFWNLAEFLAALKQNCDPATRLHVLAHSMGNRVTLRAVEALCGTIDPAGRRDPILFGRFFGGSGSVFTANTGSVVAVGPAELKQRFPEWGMWHTQNISKPQISTLICVAPDVGVAEFTRSIQNIKPICERMVLYSSDTDYALRGSRKIHGKQYRAGDSRANLELDGLYNVRVSGVDSNDPLGHSYYGSNHKVLSQLAGLLRPMVDPQQTVTQVANANTRKVR